MIAPVMTIFCSLEGDSVEEFWGNAVSQQCPLSSYSTAHWYSWTFSFGTGKNVRTKTTHKKAFETSELWTLLLCHRCSLRLDINVKQLDANFMQNICHIFKVISSMRDESQKQKSTYTKTYISFRWGCVRVLQWPFLLSMRMLMFE